jgi:hypothetical protein
MQRTPTGSLFFFRDRLVAALIQQPYVMQFARRASISRARVTDDVGLWPLADTIIELGAKRGRGTTDDGASGNNGGGARRPL